MYFHRVDLRFSLNFTHMELSATSSNFEESKILSSAKGLDESLNEGFFV